MKIKRIIGENIYSYKNLDFYFDKFPGGTTLILGKNLDQSTGNGAGKTSILKALYYGFFGSDVYKANKSEIIRRGASSFYLKIEFEDRGHDFAIERFEGRKDLNHDGKGLNFYVDGELFNGDGIEATQKNIFSKIKITPRLFLSAVYAAQDSKNSFLLASDTEKKELLAEMLDLQVYAKAFEYVKKEIESLEEKQKDRDSKIQNNNSQIELFEEQVKELVLKQSGFEEENNRELLKLREDFKKIDFKKKSLEKSKDFKYNKSEIVKSIENKKKEMIQIEDLINKEKFLILDLNNLKNEIENLNKSEELNFNEIKALEKENEDFSKISFDENYFKKVKKDIEENEFKLKENESIKNLRKNLEIEINNLNNEIKNLEKEIIQKTESIKKLENSEKCPTCHRDLEKEHIDHIEKDIFKLKKEIEDTNKSLDISYKNLNDKKGEIELLKVSEGIEVLIQNLRKEETDLLILLEKNNQKELTITKNYQKIEERKKEYLSISQKKKDLFILRDIKEKELSENYDLADKRKKTNLELESLNKDLTNAEIELNSLKNIDDQINSLKEQLEDISLKGQELKQKKNPYGEMILSVEKKIMFLLEKNKTIEKNKLEDEEEIKTLKFWKVGFAPTGIRSFITDDVIDLLNKKVQENLNDLFNGALSVFFDPESKSKKGVVSNKISTHFYLNGKETSIELLSGGEKRRIILATDLALTEIAESRAGTQLNVRFLDEQFDGMDSNGQIQAFRLFSRLSKDKDGFFVISHDENFQNMCPNVVYILKKNEISQIVSNEQFRNASINDEISDEFEKFEKTETLTTLSSEDKKKALAEKIKKIAQNKEKKD